METIDNKYYNYILLDSRKPFKWLYKNYNFDFLPFYVGKGSGDRVKNHYFNSSKENIHKYNIIQKLKLGGYTPMYSVIYENSSEEQSFKNEIDIINFIKHNLPNADLTNILEGGNLPPIHFGKDNVNAKKVYLYNSLTGNFILEWECAADACRFLNISTEMSKHICLCCNGSRRTAAGYIWRFTKENKVESELGKKYSRITFTKLIAYNSNEYYEFKSIKEAYIFLKEPNKGKINDVLKGKRNMYKGYFWDIEI